MASPGAGATSWPRRRLVNISSRAAVGCGTKPLGHWGGPGPARGLLPNTQTTRCHLVKRQHPRGLPACKYMLHCGTKPHSRVRMPNPNRTGTSRVAGPDPNPNPRRPIRSKSESKPDGAGPDPNPNRECRNRSESELGKKPESEPRIRIRTQTPPNARQELGDRVHRPESNDEETVTISTCSTHTVLSQ